MTPIDERPDHEKALDDIDAFIQAGHELAALEILDEEKFRPAASALCDVAQELMASNEYMAGWLNRDRYFDFRQDGARGEFNKVLKEYNDTKLSAGGFHQMKFRCAGIWTINRRDIEGPLGRLPLEKQRARRGAY